MTSGSNNVTKDKSEKINRLQEVDPNGLVVAVITMLIVFLSLLILFLTYKLIGIVATCLENHKQALCKAPRSESTMTANATDDPLVAVTISLALTTELELGGGEAPGQLTIHLRTQTYEPWSDKSQMMRPTMERKRLKAWYEPERLTR